MADTVVTITALEHRYGTTRALQGVDLTVAPGECVALLGRMERARPHWSVR